MVDATEDDFIRHWSETAYDKAQLAQIAAIERHIIEYAMSAWRPLTIAPPESVLLICDCDEGLKLMLMHPNGDWRTEQGTPHKPPLAWMPAPIRSVKPNGKEKS